MGLLDFFKQNMRFPKTDKVHPAFVHDSSSPSLRAATSVSVGTPSKPAPGKKTKEAGPVGWHKAGGYPNHPLPPPATYGRPRRIPSSSSFCYCLSFLFSLLVILLILAGLTILIIYAVFLPKLPKATIQNVAIKALNVINRAGGPVATLTDLHHPVLNANISFTMQVVNPNEKLGIHFRDVSMFASYNGTEFAHSDIAPFYQGKKNTSEVVAYLNASSAPLSESQGKELQLEINQHDIPLFARINVGAALQMGSWVLPPVRIRITCYLRASPPTAPHGAKLLSKSCKWLW